MRQGQGRREGRVSGQGWWWRGHGQSEGGEGVKRREGSSGKGSRVQECRRAGSSSQRIARPMQMDHEPEAPARKGSFNTCSTVGRSPDLWAMHC